ncbi:hypothetical protein [Candidatus Marithrix sp. Canyon 246]|uniref:hypothetical protein n=1 Tax=Candidatus Marithrix sp. Canyon 246 TaxID=1827136 RepID=UPI00114D0010|nr:hypothetical protein [Candidatus Marithrix sp. Canyon 246]
MQQCPNDCSQQSSNTSIVEWQDISINGFAHPAISSEVISIYKMTFFDIMNVSYHIIVSHSKF